MDVLNSLFAAFVKVIATFILAVQSLFGALSTSITYSPPAPEQSATTTPTHIVASTTAPIKHTVATTTIKNIPAPLPVKTIAPKPLPIVPALPIIDPELLNTQTRAAVVNILCTSAGGGTLRSISGSAVMVDSRGVVLTNAHVAQYFLLRDYPTLNNMDCVIRMGSPAQPLYRATLLYLPPKWVDAHASQLTAEHAQGTGEGDYAFLLITSSTNPAASLPPTFPAVAMTSASLDNGVGVLLAAYPAGFLDGTTIQQNLYVTSAFTTVQDLFTFSSTSYVDLVSVGGTVVSQGGSSGGAVMRTQDGTLAALIVTDTDAATTALRDLRAVTLSYIDRNLREQGQGGIVGLLSQNLSAEAAAFASSTALSEKQVLIKALEKH
jgi:hypothetical protein